jgi:hypothetical protein
MYDDLGGWLWLVIDVLAVIALGVVLAFATISYRRRGRKAVEQRQNALRHGHDPRPGEPHGSRAK